MTTHRSRLLDTLARIEATTLPAAPAAKTASASPPAPRDGDLLRALAGAVRGAREAPVTDDDIYAVLKVAAPPEYVIPDPDTIPTLHFSDAQLAKMHPDTAGRLLQAPVNFAPGVYEKLHALHRGGAAKQAGEVHRPSDQLRKLAAVLRAASVEAHQHRLEKAAHMLRATQALTLLGDRVRAL